MAGWKTLFGLGKTVPEGNVTVPEASGKTVLEGNIAGRSASSQALHSKGRRDFSMVS